VDTARVLAAADGYTTPVACVDLAVVDANVARMQETVSAAGAALRPHAKTHKSATIARRQLAAGACGLTVATLNEAEYFAEHGSDDLLLAHPPVGTAKLARLTALAERVGRLAVAVDSVEVAAGLPAAVEVLWEVDSGHHRLGTPPGAATVEAVQRLLDAIGEQRFRGLLTFPGHVYRTAEPEERRRIAAEEIGLLLETAGLLRARGVEVREYSVGSTPTAGFAAEARGMTEMRPGGYVYNDANQVTLGTCALDECALGVVATVISTPEPGRAVLDAGTKALPVDMLAPGLQGLGMVLGHPHLRLDRMSEEHGVLTSDRPTGLRVGDRVVVLPAHCCTTVVLHEALLFVAADGLACWDVVGARGRWQAETASVEASGRRA
jgi:D-serine deaminase-like pyridoxal phosphate-dependent protein